MNSTNWVKLPFSHGLEIENHLVMDDGSVLTGEKLVETWNAMFDGAAAFLRNLPKTVIPEIIKKKIIKVEVSEEIKRDRKLKFVFITYKIGKKYARVN
ncbi:MAG: hypothetical protein ACFFDT_04570 [Candidatus Hodarchaeota archaeon]